jgi:Ca2+-binding RTX toxin-like protein
MASIFGTAIADSLVGEQGRDAIFGYQGDDTLAAYGGNDTLYGGTGNDRLDAYLGNNLLFGGKGNDELVADAGNDTLFGGQGNDLLSGYEGNDFLSGDSGNDTLVGVFVYSFAPGGGEIDTLIGGAGNDYFELTSGSFSLDIIPQSFYTLTGNADFALILDFEVGRDKISVYALDTYALADISVPGFGSGVGVLVTTQGQNELISFLPGLTSNQLSFSRDFTEVF